MKFLISLLVVFQLFCVSVSASTFTIEAEDMTTSGQYAGKITNPFPGIGLYTNNDRGTYIHNLSMQSGNYTVSVRGASNNSNAAGVSLYVNGTKVKAFTFYGTAATVLEAEVKLVNLSTTSNTIALILETDNGNSDTFIDKITFTFLSPIVEKDPPVLPAQGAYYTGVYRNMLKEAGYTDAQIGQRLDYLWNRMFYGDPSTEAVYYPVGTDEAYILDTGNDDIRSEGMSYAMMICVQMNKKTEFDRLWKWSKTKMQFQTGPTKGYFSWQVQKDGVTRSAQPAPDGDEYFAMALMFAAGRWGNGEGMFNYWKEANYILENSMNKGHFINSSITNMFDEKEKQVVFVPYAASAKHTDPSYHLPSFYQLWSYWANNKRWFWAEVADKSREMFPKFAHPTTGLMPDYANFDGTPTGGSHADFRFDAWRCAMNMGMDYAWFKASEVQVTLINRLHNFFASKGVESYKNQYSLSGNELSGGAHSPGLVACNAGGALASNQKVAWEFIDDFFKITLTSGQYRYYDGLLYFMNYLHLSGNFKIYQPAEVLQVPQDEQYKYEGGYLILENFESNATGDEFNMRKTDTSPATALVQVNPAKTSEKALQILPGNFDEFFTLQYKLPAGRSLKTDYTHFEFDVYYVPDGDNQKQDFKVDFDVMLSTPFFKTTTGDKINHGKWERITVPLNGVNSGNTFKLFMGVRTRSANYYLDNLKLKATYDPNTAAKHTPENPIISHQTKEMIRFNTEVEGVSIYTISGTVLRNERNVSTVNIADLNPGVYIMQLSVSGTNYTLKFVK